MTQRNSTHTHERHPQSGVLFRSSRLATGLAASLLTVSTVLAQGAPAPDVLVDTFPPEPSIIQDVHGIELINGTDYEYTDPYLPLMTTTRDYRLGVSRKAYVNNGVSEVRFFLLKPEALKNDKGAPAEFALSMPGAGHWIDTFDMWADNHGTPALQADADDFHTHPVDPPVYPIVDPDFTHMHFAICDSTAGYSNGKNPYVCDNNHDCYEFDLMFSLSIYDSIDYPNPSGAQEAQLFSTRVKVKIANPKTATAEIVSAEILGSTMTGPRFVGTTGHGIGSFHTPQIVGEDNRLLVVRIGGNSVPEYTDENGAKITSGPQDMVYAINTSANQCDVTQWDELRPITFAAIDPETTPYEFGFAEHPFRTPTGHTLSPHDRITGNYLWVDQDADNLFFGSLKRPILEAQQDTDKKLYDYTCFDGFTDCLQPENTDARTEREAKFHGWMMAGLWTHGKMVLLDSKVNNMDFGIRAANKFHLNADLYSDRSIRIGTGEEATLIVGGNEPIGWARTTVQFGSTEHFLNMVDNWRHRTPRDVVWRITAGAYTDEIAFDDLISRRTLIFSPMNAAKEMIPDVVGGITYFDGNQPYQENGAYPKRLQNSATSLDYLLPSYGEVHAAAQEGRIENVALGGVKARGFYLYPQSSITYDIPSQDLSNRDWMVSLFLDRRATTSGDSRLFTFPSQAYVDLVSNTHIKLCNAGSSDCKTVLLPIPLPTKAWTHLAMVLENSGNIQLFQDGFLFAEVGRPNGLAVTSGMFEVGADSSSSQGFEGWIDELKVVEGPFNFEEICNHARGTLVSMPFSHQGAGNHRIADLEIPFHQRTPNPTHWVSGREAVHDALHNTQAFAWPLSNYYVCHVDYQNPLGISVHDPGVADVRSLRRRLLFAEGPVIHDQPRPVSASNNFCLSCHDSSRPKGLDLSALTFDAQGRDAVADPRRMPMQAPAELRGMIPAHYIAQDYPATDTDTTAQPFKTDPGTLRAPLYRWTFDEAGGSTFHNWVGGDSASDHNGDAAASGSPLFRPGVDRGHSLHFQQNGAYIQAGTNGFGGHASVDGDDLTLAGWVRLDNPGEDPAKGKCTAFSNGVTPCMMVAKSGSHVHDITWGLRLYFVPDATDPQIGDWWAQMHVTNSSGQIANRAVKMPSTFNSAVWNHIAAVYDQGTVEVFLNGTSLAVPFTIHTTHTDISVDSTEPITVGAKLQGGNTAAFPFYGRVDEVHIFDYALADWEISELVIETP